MLDLGLYGDFYAGHNPRTGPHFRFFRLHMRGGTKYNRYDVIMESFIKNSVSLILRRFTAFLQGNQKCNKTKNCMGFN